MVSWLFIPVRLSRTDKTSPSIPLWGVVLAFALPVFPLIAIIGMLSNTAFSGWSPFFLMGLVGIVGAFLLAMSSDTRLKQIKVWLDMSWNVWSYIGISFLFYVAVDNTRERLDAVLSGTGPWLKTGLFVLVCGTACGRVVIPLVEVWQSFRKSPSELPKQPRNP